MAELNECTTAARRRRRRRRKVLNRQDAKIKD
jgi:hypothetical protein